MGVYYRYAAAALILLLSADAYSAVRKTVNHGQSNKSVIDNSTSTFQTPHGEVAYFGQEHVDEHTAGYRFKEGDSPGPSTAPKQKVTVKPVSYVNKAKAAAKAVAKFRGGVVGLAATAAFDYAIDQIPGARFDPVTGEPVVKPEFQPSGSTWHLNHWSGGFAGYYPTFQAGCDAIRPQAPGGTTKVYDQSSGGNYCRIRDNFTGYYTDTYAVGYYVTLQCPNGFNPTTGNCNPDPVSEVPFTQSDWQQFENILATVNPDWLKQMIERSCEGALSPSACYDDLVDFKSITGPAELIGPPYTQTTTTTKPDGTVSTTSTTYQNKYNYTYGDNYFDFSTTTTKTVNTDGQVTTSETSDTPPEGETPPEDQSEDQDYSFQDSDLPDVPDFYDQKYPDGLQGVWNSAKADIDNSQFMQFLQSFVPSFSGSCPSFGLSFNIASWASYGYVEFNPLCYVFDFIKVILLVTAVFTARAITFGG